MKYGNDLKTLIAKLNFQRNRIVSTVSALDTPGFPVEVHDADFYTILLRRITRRLFEESKLSPKIKAIINNNKRLFEKVKMRDHFEHPEKIDKYPQIEISELPPGAFSGKGSITVVASVVSNPNESVIVSGNFIWNLNQDHTKLLTIIDQAMKS